MATPQMAQNAQVASFLHSLAVALEKVGDEHPERVSSVLSSIIVVKLYFQALFGQSVTMLSINRN